MINISDSNSKNKLQTAAIDVTSYDSIASSISKESDSIGAMVFAASDSSKGGDTCAADKDGVVNAAKVCVDFNIPRLLVVSSGSVSRIDSNNRISLVDVR